MQIYVKYFTLCKIFYICFQALPQLHQSSLLSPSYTLPSHSQVLPPHKPEPPWPSHSQFRWRHSSPVALIVGSTSVIIASTHRVWFNHSNPPILFSTWPYTSSNSTDSFTTITPALPPPSSTHPLVLRSSFFFFFFTTIRVYWFGLFGWFYGLWWVVGRLGPLFFCFSFSNLWIWVVRGVSGWWWVGLCRSGGGLGCRWSGGGLVLWDSFLLAKTIETLYLTEWRNYM